jgi:hypothetical protein
MTEKRTLVLTTINPPNEALRTLAAGCTKHDMQFIIAGDTNSPADFFVAGADFLDIDKQIDLFSNFAQKLPVRHYTRKNIAYLTAIKNGCDAIQETDDDNFPYDTFWNFNLDTSAISTVASSTGWYNAYSHFTSEHIWPRGYALSKVNQPGIIETTMTSARGYILQGLANENPDVDAIYRLTSRLPVNFQEEEPIMLAPGTWGPFNSQNTIFMRDVFPLLYLPSFCSFRMTDIWRSFVAQRCLWELGEGVIFHSATVYQERNEHDLMMDFNDEISGYRHNESIATHLEACDLNKDDMGRNLVLCYEKLIKKKIIGKNELGLVNGWVKEIEQLL